MCSRRGCRDQGAGAPPVTDLDGAEPRSATALVAHHALDDALAGLGDLAVLAQPVGAVGAYLASFASDLDGHELGHLVVAFATGRHETILLATAGGCTNIQLVVERRGDQLDIAQH